jgi:hypothetical protein
MKRKQVTYKGGDFPMAHEREIKQWSNVYRTWRKKGVTQEFYSLPSSKS